MAIPKHKDELLQAIHENYAKLKSELAGIPLELSTKKELEGHAKNTLMSINNLLSYLLGWAELVLKWIDRKDKGLPVDFPETGFKWNELGLLARKFYKDHDQDNFVTLQKKLNTSIEQLLKVVEGKTNKELYEMSWHDTWTLGRMIQLNTSSPFKNARGRIRRWKKSKHLS